MASPTPVVDGLLTTTALLVITEVLRTPLVNPAIAPGSALPGSGRRAVQLLHGLALPHDLAADDVPACSPRLTRPSPG